MYAVILVGGKQFKVSQGDIIYTDLIGADEGSEVKFKVLARYDDKNFSYGTPFLNSIASAKVIKNGKKKKITVFKYKPKKNYKRKKGHRQGYSKLEITSIG